MAVASPRRSRGAALETVSKGAAAVPALVGVGTILVLGATEGGFHPTDWYPASLLLLALLVVAAFALPVPRPSRAAAVAVGLLGAYAAWSWLSVAWADSTGIAVEGANRTVLYAIVFALFALWPLRGRQAAVVIGVLALGIGAIGLIELLRADTAADPVGYFFRGRLSEPVGYANANVALWTLGLLPCLVFASRREVHPLLRGLFSGFAGVLVGLALLGQSRSWFFALPLVAVLYVALVPGRGRALAALACLAVGVAAMLSPVLDMLDATTAETVGPAISDATRAILVSAAGLTVLGVVVAYADRRVDVGAATSRRVSAGAVGAAAILAVCGVLVLAIAAGNPIDTLGDKWQEFKKGGSTTAKVDSSRFTSDLATHRYDIWRVAWENFERKPLAGIGADNYQQDYLQRGESEETPRYPHSVVLRTLSQTGIVGFLLLGGALAAALVALLPGVRRERGLAGAAAAAGAVGFGYWMLHGSVDWLWEFPALGGAAFAMLGVAVAVGRSEDSDDDETAPRRAPAGALRLGATVAGLAAASLCACAFLLPWLAERDMDRALGEWRNSPGAAFETLDRASNFNRLSARPALTAGSIAVAIDSLDVAEKSFAEATDRDPRNSFALLMAGAIASERGNQSLAKDFLARARVASPNSQVIAAAGRRIDQGQRVDAVRVAAKISAATRARVSPVLQD